MQLSIRADNDNYVTFDIRLQASDGNGPSDGPEINSATVIDSKFSKLNDTQLLAITSELLDYLSAETTPVGNAPSGDWFTNEWLPATK